MNVGGKMVSGTFGDSTGDVVTYDVGFSGKFMVLDLGMVTSGAGICSDDGFGTNNSCGSCGMS